MIKFQLRERFLRTVCGALLQSNISTNDLRMLIKEMPGDPSLWWEVSRFLEDSLPHFFSEKISDHREPLETYTDQGLIQALYGEAQRRKVSKKELINFMSVVTGVNRDGLNSLPLKAVIEHFVYTADEVDRLKLMSFLNVSENSDAYLSAMERNR